MSNARPRSDAPRRDAPRRDAKQNQAGGALKLAPDLEWPGQSTALLRALGILTERGALTADARRKLKQVQHLVTLLRPFLDAAFEANEEPVLADCGAGKSYLGFVLYDLIFGPRGRGRVAAIEARPALVEATQARAAQFGMERLTAHAAPIAEARLPHPVHLVTALHACDTATDDAIRMALAHDARWIALVPCCQAEAARLLGDVPSERLSPLWRHPIQRREFGSHITNVIRALFLEARGYRVRVTELTGLEHSMKNELILAERIQRGNRQAERQLAALLEEVPLPLGLLSSHPVEPVNDP